jgi:hypothetical protein
MKLINILNETKDDMILQKGRNVYNFLKQGTFTMKRSVGLDFKYNYTAPEDYGLYIVRDDGRTDLNGRTYGDRPVIQIPANKDGNWMDEKNAFLFEPLTQESEIFLLTHHDKVASEFESYLGQHKFRRYRVILDCDNLLIKINYEGKVQLVYDFTKIRNEDFFNHLKEGRIESKDSAFQGKGFKYKLPTNKVSIGPTSITVTGQIEYECDKDYYPKYETIKSMIKDEFKQFGVNLNIASY